MAMSVLYVSVAVKVVMALVGVMGLVEHATREVVLIDLVLHLCSLVTVMMMMVSMGMTMAAVVVAAMVVVGARVASMGLVNTFDRVHETGVYFDAGAVAQSYEVENVACQADERRNQHYKGV
mmetsp:Transcript_4683/g.7973  ORF Transcript_4683/g.7973 Transcript_4683/m.7973 type:complete len:122 (+) Transcript_4683:929-1294(+)